MFGRAKDTRGSGAYPTSHVLDDSDPHVLLLAGAPGLGKTTLAHVIARHAGYEVFEINASDDRSRDVLLHRIYDAAENLSIGTPSNSKPKCIILDEIDGAMGGGEARVCLFDLYVT